MRTLGCSSEKGIYAARGCKLREALCRGPGKDRSRAGALGSTRCMRIKMLSRLLVRAVGDMHTVSLRRPWGMAGSDLSIFGVAWAWCRKWPSGDGQTATGCRAPVHYCSCSETFSSFPKKLTQAPHCLCFINILISGQEIEVTIPLESITLVYLAVI